MCEDAASIETIAPARSRPIREGGAGMSRVALVAGVDAIIGEALPVEIPCAPGWRGLALSHKGGITLDDLTDAGATRTARGAARDATRPFCVAFKPGGGSSEKGAIGAAMLRNLFDGTEAVGAVPERAALPQSAEVYGVRLGPVPPPLLRRRSPPSSCPARDCRRARAGMGHDAFDPRGSMSCAMVVRDGLDDGQWRATPIAGRGPTAGSGER